MSIPSTALSAIQILDADVSIRSLQSQESLTVGSQRTLTLATDSAISETLTLANSSTRDGAARLTVANLEFFSGTLAGVGSTVVTTQLNLNSGNGGLLPQINRHTLELSEGGNGTWTGGSVDLSNGGLFVNAGSLEVRGDYKFERYSSGPRGTFRNSGTLTKTATTGDSAGTGGAFLENSGRIVSTAGHLAFYDGGNSSGEFITNSTGAIIFGGNHTLTTTSSLVSGRNVYFAVSTRTVLGSVSAATNLDVYQSDVDFQGSVQLGPDSRLTLTGDGGRTFVTFHDQELCVAEILLDARGESRFTSGPITTRKLTWQRGTIAGTGTLTVTQELVMTGNQLLTLDGRTLELATGATGVWTGDSADLANGAVFDNAGTLEVRGDFGFHRFSGTAKGTFRNRGTFEKTATSGNQAGTGDMFFENSGRVISRAGHLGFNGGGTSSGSFETDGSGSIFFDNGHTFTATSSIRSGRLVVFRSGTYDVQGLLAVGTDLLIRGDVTVANAIQISADAEIDLTNTARLNLHDQALNVRRISLEGSGSLRSGDIVTRELIVNVRGNGQQARLQGTGQILVTKQATLGMGSALPGVDVRLLIDGRTLEIAETATATLGGTLSLFLDNGAAVINRGILAVETFVFVTFAGNGAPVSVTNFGIYRITSEFGANFASSVTFSNPGTVEIAAGTLAVALGSANAGAFSVAAGATLALTGTGIVNFNVSGPGRVLVNGNLTFGSAFSGRQLELGVGGRVDFQGRDIDLDSLRLTTGSHVLSGNMTVGTLTADGGALLGAGTTTVTGGATIAGPGHSSFRIEDGRTLRLAPGTTNELRLGLLILQNGGVLSNAGTTTFQGRTAQDLDSQSTDIRPDTNQIPVGTLVNEATGLWHSRGNFTVYAPLTNDGAFDVDEGYFSTQAGTTSRGMWEASTDGRLQFGPGMNTFSETSAIHSLGDVSFGGRSLVAGSYDVTRKTGVDNERVTFTGRVLSIGATLALSRGQADFRDAQLDPNARTLETLTLAGGTLTIDGEFRVTTLTAQPLQGTPDHLGALLGAGTTTVTGGATIAGPGHSSFRIEDGRTLRLAPGTTNELRLGLLILQNGGVLSNAGTLTFQGRTAQDLDLQSTDIRPDTNQIPVGTLVNEATGLWHSRGNFTVYAPLTNDGAFDVDEGYLAALAGGTHSGTFDTSKTALLNLNGEHAFSSTSRLSGPGDLRVEGVLVVAGRFEVTGRTTRSGRIDFTRSAQVVVPIGRTPDLPRFDVSAVDFDNAEFRLDFDPEATISEQTAFSLFSVRSGFDGTPRISTPDGVQAMRESVPFDLNFNGHKQSFLATFEGGDGNDLVLVPLEAERDLGTLEIAEDGPSLITTGSGTVDVASDKDLFRFRTPNVPLDPGQSLEIAVALKQPDGSLLDPHVRVFQVMADGSLLRVAFDDDSGDVRDALAKFYAKANEEFVVVAGGFASTTGAYQLEVSVTGRVLDDFPNVFNSARAVAGLDPIEGSIERPDDLDFLEVTAAETGLLDITQSSPGNRNVLFVFDSRQRLLGFKEGADSTTVRVNVRENDRLIVRSSLGEGAIGQYDVTFSNPNPGDDFPNDFRGARNASLETASLSFDAEGRASLFGNIEVFADRDMVSFVSTFTGRLTTRLRADAGSLLDPVLTVFDSLRQVLVANDDLSASNRNSFVSFDVSRGTRYFVQAAGFGGIDDLNRPAGQTAPTGAYVLELSPERPDDVADVVAEATAIVLDKFGRTAVAKALQHDGDVDVFEVIVTKTGKLTVTLSSDAEFFTGSLDVLTDRSVQIAQTESLHKSGPLTLVVGNITAGQKFFVRVGGSATTTAGPQGETNVGYELAVANQETQTSETPLVDAKTGLELERELVNGLARALEQFAAEDDAVTSRDFLDENPPPNVTVESDVRVHVGGEVAEATNESIVASFLLTQGGQANLTEPVFLIWIDPIMPQASAFTSTDVVRTGNTIDNGTVNQAQARNYYSGDGVTQLLILSARDVQRFEVNLLGLGGTFRVGINHITRDSRSTVTIQDSLYKDSVRLVYDFVSSPQNPTVTQIIPRASLTPQSTTADQMADMPALMAQMVASLTAAARAAAQAEDAAGNAGASTGLPSDADRADDADGDPNNRNPAGQPTVLRSVVESLLTVFSSNESNLTQLPGAEVLQQVVNFLRQWLAQPNPPAPGTNGAPPNNPANSGTSTNPPPSNKPGSNTPTTTSSKTNANSQAAAQVASQSPPGNQRLRPRQPRSVAKV